MHRPIANTRILKKKTKTKTKKKRYFKEKKRGRETEEKERKARVFFFFFPAIALAGIFTSRGSSHLRLEPKETALPTCATIIVQPRMGVHVQSFNHLGLHFQLGKKKKKRIQKKHNWILSLAHWVKSVLLLLLLFLFFYFFVLLLLLFCFLFFK